MGYHDAALLSYRTSFHVTFHTSLAAVLGRLYVHDWWLLVSNVKRFCYMKYGRLARMSVLDTEVDGLNPGNSMLCP